MQKIIETQMRFFKLCSPRAHNIWLFAIIELVNDQQKFEMDSAEG